MQRGVREIDPLPPDDGSFDPPVDSGPWTVGTTANPESAIDRVYVESDDFHHDARLYISGDFVSDNQRVAYANMIADRLNTERQLYGSYGDALREKYPALQQAWDHFQIIWRMCDSNE